MSDPASGISIQEIRQSFAAGFWMRPLEVLHGVTLEIPKGSIYGFMGANGAGKTTLIHLLVGLRAPTSGVIRIFGKDPTQKNTRAHLGYLPERPYFPDFLTGEVLLRHLGTLSGLKGSDLSDRIANTLKQVRMEKAAKKELRHYSKGMLQRIALAQSLLHDPDFLVLDEPMSGLDPRGRREVRDLILEQKSRGKTVFFSTHLVHDAELLCDQAAIIEKGTILRAGPLSEFHTKGESLESAVERIQLAAGSGEPS